MADINWTCPHCERAVTISPSRRSNSWHTLTIPNSEGRQSLVSNFYVCPNVECNRLTLSATLYRSARKHDGGESVSEQLHQWDLMPSSAAKSFPDYIPKAILDDYTEACEIVALSPKAPATLSRRCLQGIVRDFWKVKPGRLVDEIEAIKDRTDPETWDAITAVRKLGNIGAHMEKDINVIIDVDPEEAGLLVGLIEILLKEWYVTRETRRVRMASIVAAAQEKA
jgi:hypothetical protein